LPTFFNSDLDSFSIIDYDINKDLVGTKDLKDLKELDIKLKFDIVLNHLSVASPQFKDLLNYGNKSNTKISL
jgi:sucrose phosphorylase